jgi:hypothetical protein
MALVLLFCALLGLKLLWPRAAWSFVAARDQAVADRALRDAASIFGTTPDDYRWTARPIVTRLADRTCVMLRSSRRDGEGSYRACYGARDGKVVEERALGGF